MNTNIELSPEACYMLSQIIEEGGLGKRLLRTYRLEIYSYEELKAAITTTLPELETHGFIKVSPGLKFEIFDGHPLKNTTDAFTFKFVRLLQEGHTENAIALAKIAEIPFFESLVAQKATLEDARELIINDAVGSELFEGIRPNLRLEIEVKQRGVMWIAKNSYAVSKAYELKHPPYVSKYPTRIWSKPTFDIETGNLWVGRENVKFSKTTKQYEALKVIFSDPHKDWQFDEINELLDPQADKGNWKVLYDLFLAIQRKIAAASDVKNFFIVNRHSAKITPKVLNVDHYADDDEEPGIA